ncbi:MAG: response regulator transcription factor [Candidatus Ornithomonoglobus sp.]
MQTVYCVEDDEGIRELIAYAVKTAGIEVKEFADGLQFEKALKEGIPSLVLLDIMLPDKDGIEILTDLRNNPATKRLPVILLTAKNGEMDKVKGLNLGADDYITKPFSVLELISRIKAVLRRAEYGAEPEKDYHGIVVDLPSRKVTVDGKEVQLTYKEFELLNCLTESQGRVINREYLLRKIWGFDFEGETRTLDVHIGSLRHKLGDKSKYIETVRNVGYKFV